MKLAALAGSVVLDFSGTLDDSPLLWKPSAWPAQTPSLFYDVGSNSKRAIPTFIDECLFERPDFLPILVKYLRGIDDILGALPESVPITHRRSTNRENLSFS